MKESLLINAFGHLAGVVVFGIFIVLLIQDHAARTSRGGVKSLIAAGLAFAWNLGSLVVLGVPENQIAWAAAMAAASFSVLSLLPGVLFDLSLGKENRALVRVGYCLSAMGIVFHVLELFRPRDAYHVDGLTLITVGFGGLTLLAAIQLLRSKQSGAPSRLIATMALFLFAASFVHLGNGHAQQIWSQELAFHHAGIPLAMLVLLQDYRFILIDAFVRFLANVFLAGLVILAGVGAWQWHLIPPPDDPFHEALLVGLAAVALIGFGVMREQLQRWLSRQIFRRGNESALFEALRRPAQDESEYLIAVASAVGSYFGATGALSDLDTGVNQPALIAQLQPRRPDLERNGTEAVMPLRLSSGGSRSILLGRRQGGRRYLSEDLEVLTRATLTIVEGVEQIRKAEMRRLVTQAELRALQSQIHPHFLFNALNTLYGIIPPEARGARNTVLNLADIFRYFLETGKTHVPLEEELHIVRSYLEIERLRLGDKLRVDFAIDPEVAQVPIPILSVQPLVENAVKHGIAPATNGGIIRVEAFGDDQEVSIVVINSGAALTESTTRRGVGLENVKRRLELSYAGRATVTVSAEEHGTTARIRIPRHARVAAGVAS